MGRPRTWTDEQLRTAVAVSRSYKGVKLRLGLSPTGAGHYDIKARVRALGLDTSHFARPAVASTHPWTEAELRQAVIGAAHRQEVLERLRVPVQSKYFARLQRDLLELGIEFELTGRVRRPRRWTDDQLRDAVATTHGVAATIRALGLIPAGGNYDLVQRRIRDLGLDTSHFQGPGWSRGMNLGYKPKVPLGQVLVAGRWTSSQALKERLLRAGLKHPACEMCGWAQRSSDGRLPIELDHINGDKNDNRIENLRILCPNCHSLQPTHRGSNQRHRRR